MPLALLIAAVAAALVTIAGVSWFRWTVYARVGVGPVTGGVGIGGPGASPGDGAGGAGGADAVPMLLLLAVGGGLLLILSRR